MRAAPAIGAAFVVAVALAITITGPLLLFNPWLVAFEQGRQDVPQAIGTTDGEVARLTNAMLGDIFLNGDFAVSLSGGQPYLDAAERSHMRDVGGLVRTLLLVDLLALAAGVLAGRWLRRDRDLRGRLLLSGAAGVGVAAVLVGAFFAFAFDAAFTAFHGLFFAAGTWQFAPGSPLITLFPEPFWFDLALAAGASIVVGAAIVGWLGLRDLRAVPAAA
jgi:integral membrane protein (TIGR01906 family)